MATMIIRGLDDASYARIKADAEARGGSVESELAPLPGAARPRLTREQARDRDDFLNRLRALRETIYSTHGPLPDTTELIRQMREEE